MTHYKYGTMPGADPEGGGGGLWGTPNVRMSEETLRVHVRMHNLSVINICLSGPPTLPIILDPPLDVFRQPHHVDHRTCYQYNVYREQT